MSGDVQRTPPRWPLLVISLGAFVSIWGGWVGLGQLAGFGPVRLLPGIADEWRINSAITLPLGVEAYAAYAMATWLAPRHWRVSDKARTFALWSSVAALGLGVFGQATYHLLVTSGATVAPGWVVVFVSCLPVLVLGAGAALTHLIHQGDADAREGDVDEDPVAAVVRAAEQQLKLDIAPPDLDPADEDEADPVDDPAGEVEPDEQLHFCSSRDGVPDPSCPICIELQPWLDGSRPLADRLDLAFGELNRRSDALVAQGLQRLTRPVGRRRAAELAGVDPESYEVRKAWTERARRNDEEQEISA